MRSKANKPSGMSGVYSCKKSGWSSEVDESAKVPAMFGDVSDLDTNTPGWSSEVDESAKVPAMFSDVSDLDTNTSVPSFSSDSDSVTSSCSPATLWSLVSMLSAI
jgi:hypothetical protein